MELITAFFVTVRIGFLFGVPPEIFVTLFKDAAHLWVGGMIAVAYRTRRQYYPRPTHRDHAIILIVVEVVCAILMRVMR